MPVTAHHCQTALQVSMLPLLLIATSRLAHTFSQEAEFRAPICKLAALLNYYGTIRANDDGCAPLAPIVFCNSVSAERLAMRRFVANNAKAGVSIL